MDSSSIFGPGIDFEQDAIILSRLFVNTLWQQKFADVILIGADGLISTAT